MSYLEPLQQTLYNTALNYNQAMADIVSTEVGGIAGIEIAGLGVVIVTAMVVTTAPVVGLDTLAIDRTTKTVGVLTVTVPNGAAIGNVYINRGGTGAPVKLTAGQLYTITVSTLGVGSAGSYKPFVLWRYRPTGDISTVSILTA